MDHNLKLINYSEKAIALLGTNKEMASTIKSWDVWGKFNPRLKHPETKEQFAGWVFSKKEEEKVRLLVMKLQGNEEIEVFTLNKEPIPKTNISFNQHLKAYMRLKELRKEFEGRFDKREQEITIDTSKDTIIVDGNYLTEGKHTIKQYLKTYIDSEGRIHIKGEYLHSQWGNFRHSKFWSVIAKSGKITNVSRYDLEKCYYEYPDGIIGVKDKEGRMKIGDKKTGYSKDYSINKLKKQMVETLQGLGYTDIRTSASTIAFTPIHEGVKKFVVGDIENLTEFEIPKKLFVPKNKRAPHYNLPQDAKKLKKDTLLIEVLLGKLEITLHSHFDGMQDMSVLVEDNWYIPTLTEIPDNFYTNSPSCWSGSTIYWGDAGRAYNLRYTGKNAKAYIDLEAEKPQHEPARDLETTEDERQQIAKTFQEKANKAFKKADEKLNSGIFSQNWTPRRAGIMESLKHDAEVLKDLGVKYQALAIGWGNNTIPKTLQRIRTATEINELLTGRKYPTITEHTRDWAKEEIEKSKSRLAKIGVTNEQQFQETKTDLLNIGEYKESEEEKDKREVEEMRNKFRRGKTPGFFPTPEKVVNKMLEYAEISEGHTILEPSAGLGHMAEIIKKTYSNNPLDVIEYNNSMCKVLMRFDFNLFCYDFLKFDGNYDRIIMNPPFENLQDTEHVKHAYNCLNEGGRLVSIMSTSPFHNSNKKAQAFREWLDSVGGYKEDLPENSFAGKDAFIQTKVNTVLVVIDK